MSKSGLVHCLLLQPFMKIQKLLKLRRFQKVKFSNGYTSKIRHNCCFNQKYCLIFLSMGFINMHFSVLLKLYNSQTFSLSLVLQHKTPIGAMFTLHVLILFFLFIIFCYLLFTVFYLFFLFLMAAPRSLMQEAIFPLASSHQISMGTFGPFYTIIITFHHSSNCTHWNIYVKKE